MIDTRVGRNAPCPCGSGQKFKKCCLNRQPRGLAADVLRLQQHFQPPNLAQRTQTAASGVPPGKVEPGNERVIGTTAEHPFYVWGKGWTPLAEIRPGDWIRTDDGWVEVNGVRDTGRYETVYNIKVADYHTYFVGGADWGFAVWAHNASCDPAEVAHVEQEMASNQSNMGVGVIDKRTGQVRLFSYDETDAFSRANPQLQVMAGHESAAAMAGIPPDQARGFVLGKQGGDWHVFNQSHLNLPDAQTNTMRMEPQLFNDIVTALQGAGVQNPIVH